MSMVSRAVTSAGIAAAIEANRKAAFALFGRMRGTEPLACG
jgi:hypothetical protein